jgi:hypothetical protein
MKLVLAVAADGGGVGDVAHATRADPHRDLRLLGVEVRLERQDEQGDQSDGRASEDSADDEAAFVMCPLPFQGTGRYSTPGFSVASASRSPLMTVALPRNP